MISKFLRKVFLQLISRIKLCYKKIYRKLNTMIFSLFILSLLFFTGLRFGESAALLWENVDLDEGKIKVLYTVGNRSKKVGTISIYSKIEK